MKGKLKKCENGRGGALGDKELRGGVFAGERGVRNMIGACGLQNGTDGTNGTDATAATRRGPHFARDFYSETRDLVSYFHSPMIVRQSWGNISTEMWMI